MEDEISKNDKGGSALLPALGILGLGIGVISLALSIFCLSKMGDATSDFNDKFEKAASLSLEMKKISDRVDSIALQLESIKSTDNSRVADLAKEINSAMGQVGQALQKQAGQIEENRKAIEEVARRANSARRSDAASASETAQSSSNGASAQAQNTGARTHVNQSGDTFAKLAVKYKVSVDAIINANPDLNPSRLKIGQEVVIPQ